MAPAPAVTYRHRVSPSPTARSHHPIAGDAYCDGRCGVTLFAITSSLGFLMAALYMAHAPRKTDESRDHADHGQGADSFAEGSATLGHPSAAAKGTPGFGAGDNSSSKGSGTSLASYSN